MNLVQRGVIDSICFTLAILANSVACLAQATWIEEPPIRVSLTVGGGKHEIECGKQTAIVVEDRRLQVTVTPLASRTFSLKGVHFDYPTDFRFRLGESKPENGILHYCILSGNEFHAYIAERAPAAELKELADHRRQKSKNLAGTMALVEERKCELKTERGTFEGTEFKYSGEIEGHHCSQLDQCFVFPTSNQKSCLYFITSIIGDKPTTDAIKFRSGLEKSLIIDRVAQSKAGSK
jgi:hypothetical protein